VSNTRLHNWRGWFNSMIYMKFVFFKSISIFNRNCYFLTLNTHTKKQNKTTRDTFCVIEFQFIMLVWHDILHNKPLDIKKDHHMSLDFCIWRTIMFWCTVVINFIILQAGTVVRVNWDFNDALAYSDRYITFFCDHVNPFRYIFAMIS